MSVFSIAGGDGDVLYVQKNKMHKKELYTGKFYVFKSSSCRLAHCKNEKELTVLD